VAPKGDLQTADQLSYAITGTHLSCTDNHMHQHLSCGACLQVRTTDSPPFPADTKALHKHSSYDSIIQAMHQSRPYAACLILENIQHSSTPRATLWPRHNTLSIPTAPYPQHPRAGITPLFPCSIHTTRACSVNTSDLILCCCWWCALRPLCRCCCHLALLQQVKQPAHLLCILLDLHTPGGLLECDAAAATALLAG